jgi:hypothetical protein
MGRTAALLSVTMFLLAGCGDGDEAAGSEHSDLDSCPNYQNALCDWTMRCTNDEQRSACDARAGTIVCRTDGRAKSCAAAIKAASCDKPPQHCELFDVADRAPARQACEDYGRAFCNAAVGCGLDTPVTCEKALTTLDCSLAFGVKPSYPSCLADLAAPSCADFPPSSCQGIMLAE